MRGAVLVLAVVHALAQHSCLDRSYSRVFAWSTCAGGLPGEADHVWRGIKGWLCEAKSSQKEAQCNGWKPPAGRTVAESASTMNGMLFRYGAPSKRTLGESQSTDASTVCVGNIPMQMDCPEGLVPDVLDSNADVPTADLDGGTLITEGMSGEEWAKFRLLGCTCKSLKEDNDVTGCQDITAENGKQLKWLFSGHAIACATDANSADQRDIVAGALAKFQDNWSNKVKSMVDSAEGSATFPNDIVNVVDASLRKAVAKARSKLCVGQLPVSGTSTATTCAAGQVASEAGGCVDKPWGDYVDCATEKSMGACSDGNSWVAVNCATTCATTGRRLLGSGRRRRRTHSDNSDDSDHTGLHSGGFICADSEESSCLCAGKVFYGRKFVSGQPGQGTITTLEQLKASAHVVKEFSGTVQCSNDALGDPLPGYYKHCYCEGATYTLEAGQPLTDQRYDTAAAINDIASADGDYTDSWPQVKTTVISSWRENMQAAGLTIDLPKLDTEPTMEGVTQADGSTAMYAALKFTVYDQARKLCTESDSGGGERANYYLVRIEHDCAAKNFMRSSVVMKSVKNKGALEDTAEFKVSTCPPEGCDIQRSPNSP